MLFLCLPSTANHGPQEIEASTPEEAAVTASNRIGRADQWRVWPITATCVRVLTTARPQFQVAEAATPPPWAQ